MHTQEERITALERTTSEYKPILQNIAYELTMVKGLTIDQISATQNLRQDMSEVKDRLTKIEEQIKGRFTKMEEQLNTILTLLKP